MWWMNEMHEWMDDDEDDDDAGVWPLECVGWGKRRNWEHVGYGMNEWVRKWERSGCFDFPPIAPTWNPRACLARKCPRVVGYVVKDGTSVFRRWVRGKCCCRSLLSELKYYTLLLTWPSIFSMPTRHPLLFTKPLSFYTLHSTYLRTPYTLHYLYTALPTQLL